MKVLFVMTHPGYVRNFEWAIRGLADQGHAIHVIVEKRAKDPGVDGLLDSLESEYELITTARATGVGALGPGRVAQVVRVLLDYMRYLEPEFADAPKLRDRAAKRIPGPLRRSLATGKLSGPGAKERIRGAGRAIHEGLPVARGVTRLVEEAAPDVVLLTPFLELASPQHEYLRAAKGFGIPASVPVASWDNLTNKGLFHQAPDLITVWNDAQVAEACDLHGMPRTAVEVTGAVAYDHWFGWEPDASREELCGRVGLDPARPFVLYVGSSPFIAPKEPAVALRWIRGIRESDERLSDLQVLVRPHPQNPMRGGARFELESMPGVSVYPPDGANPMDDASRNDYFDSIHHCAAVLGVNTSALLEASIVDRPVHTLLEPEYSGTQMGTLHFRHLLPDNGGMLEVTESIEELGAAVARSLDGRFDAARNRAFVTSFLRPHGMNEPGSPRLVAAVERLAAEGRRAPVKPPLTTRALGLVSAVAGTAALAVAFVIAKARRVARRAYRRVRHGLFAVAMAAAEAVAPRGADGARRVWPRPENPVPKGPGRRRLQAQTSYLRGQLAPLAEGDGPVIAGPFLGEVGFELLYWIPFLRWSAHQFPELGERLVITSRGGTRGWYGELAGRYVDVLDIVSFDELTSGTARLKQRGEITPLERKIHDGVSDALGLDGARILHPTPMWRAYYASLKARESAFVDGVGSGRPGEPVPGLHSSYRRMDPPDHSGLADILPEEDYAAVRFYFRPSFPDTPQNRALARTVVEELGRRMPVVLLNNGMDFDEHRDMDLAQLDNVIGLRDQMTPANNLEVQSVAMSRARLFAGTYGGLAYLAPHYGVSSVGFTEDNSLNFPWHLELAQKLFSNEGWGSLSVQLAADRGAVTKFLGALDREPALR